MDIRLKNFLVSKGVIIYEDKAFPDPEEIISSLVTMRQHFGVKINKGKHLASQAALRTLEEQLAKKLPRSFYKDFPRSVLNLTVEQKVLDQAIHYLRTYGLGDFSEGKYSIFEEENPIGDLIQPGIIDESVNKILDILTEEDAYLYLEKVAKDMLLSSRPLSPSQFEVLCLVITERKISITPKLSKNTAIRLSIECLKGALKKPSMLKDTSPNQFWGSLSLSDGLKLLENALENVPGSGRRRMSDVLKDYSLPNKVRKVMTEFIKAKLVDAKQKDFSECSERMKLWNSLLFHIHFKPETAIEKAFTQLMRSGKNCSVPSKIQEHLKNGDIDLALFEASRNKGGSYLLRNLSMFLGQAKTEKEKQNIITDAINGATTIALYQILLFFRQYPDKRQPRTFKFVKNNKLCVVEESRKSAENRSSFVDPNTKEYIISEILSALNKRNSEHDLSSLFGKVYLDPKMKKIALPIQESTGSSGLGTLTRGSRLPLGTKSPRVFTSWSKVNDIDIACFVLSKNGIPTHEYSWRSMSTESKKWIRFSGDITNGFNGATEYFDLDIEKLKESNPDATHVVVTDNVFSGMMFSECECKAGFMLRENLLEGAAYEAKTVGTSFKINANARMAYLFAIDLEKDEIIWLNTAVNLNTPIAGTSNIDMIRSYFDITDTLNVYGLIESSVQKENIVERPEDADTIVSDDIIADDPENPKRFIKSSDTELIMTIMEHKMA